MARRVGIQLYLGQMSVRGEYRLIVIPKESGAALAAALAHRLEGGETQSQTLTFSKTR